MDKSPSSLSSHPNAISPLEEKKKKLREAIEYDGVMTCFSDMGKHVIAAIVAS